MRKGLLSTLLIVISFVCIAQQYPPEWLRYTSGGYLFDIQSERNLRNRSETAFNNYLLNIARTNIAKQVRLQVHDFAELNKKSIDGSSTVVYTSNTYFSTDVELKLVETKTYYDPETKQGYAIAYIDKYAACQYYRNAVASLLNKADNSLALARDFIGAGFKHRAKVELEALLNDFETTEEAFFWLGIFGVSFDESEKLHAQYNEKEGLIKQRLADLQYGTSICLICSTDIFGTRYPTLQNELKGKLAAEGCNFTDDPLQADWVIRVEVSTREYNRLTINSQSLYFAYADANISIDKVISSQRIYEDGLSAKGGHTMNYKEAARTACEELVRQLGTLILQNIQR